MQGVSWTVRWTVHHISTYRTIEIIVCSVLDSYKALVEIYKQVELPRDQKLPKIRVISDRTNDSQLSTLDVGPTSFRLASLDTQTYNHFSAT